ncbi:hypothetical protein [Saccharomonospora iraqiensis]|uniref:hypothetical protein n=1 Tax=Saccharomonospora iraqiensis TaxID=52698 RepID=UPI00022E8999|nr:hypothetical protein [Saccharomonospora iraqiensis]
MARWFGVAAAVYLGMAVWAATIPVSPAEPNTHSPETCGTALARSREFERMLGVDNTLGRPQLVVMGRESYEAIVDCDRRRGEQQIVTTFALGGAVASGLSAFSHHRRRRRHVLLRP